MNSGRPDRSARRGWSTALLVFLGITSVAQATPSDDHLHFQRLMPADGMPAAVVYSISEDSRGFLWFGTADGAARFDGVAFKVFRPNPADPTSLTNAAVLAIQEDRHGDLWMATEGGLEMWHRDTEQFSHFRHNAANPASLSDDTTQCLQIDRDGTMWVGTRREGLDHFDPVSGRWEHFTPAPDSIRTINDPWVRCLFFDRTGALWIGTGDGGLNHFDPKTREFHAYRHDPKNPRSISHDRISAITEDHDGNLWVATDDGLDRFDPERKDFERHPIDRGVSGDASPSPTATALLADQDHRLWVGTDGGGFGHYDPKTRTLVRNTHSDYAHNTLAADSVRAVFEDRRGDFWVGHFPAGVSHSDRAAGAFQIFTSTPGQASSLSDDHVLSFWEEPSGDLWVGTDNGGLNHWSETAQQWTNFRHSPATPGSLAAKAALTVCRDHTGRLWVGTWGGGVDVLQPDGTTFRHYFHAGAGRPDSLSDSHAWQIVEDHEQRLWIATIGGGVNRYAPESDSFVHYRHDPSNPEGLNDDIVSAMMVAADGTLWAGTAKGLAHWDSKMDAWQRFHVRSGEHVTLDEHWIFDLAEDRDGTIWATTEGGGLNHVDPRTGGCETFRVADGLPTDTLRGLLLDESGLLWIGSNRGLIRFDPVQRKVRVFDESNGLPGSLFAPHARLRLRSGEFLFGTTQGFVRFDPRALVPDLRPPAVVLTEFQVFNDVVTPAVPGSPLRRSITETRELVIPWKLSVVSFQFAALSFRSTARTQYRFKLEGFDAGWRTPGPERRAMFTNLDPGQYRLRVIAANGDGAWNEEGVSLALTIVPPWWRTWWFKSGAAVILLGGAAVFGWRVAAHRAWEAQRERELANERERARERAEAAENLGRLNQELEQRVADRTAQLASTVKELEAFSYSVAHDLRSPLRSLDGFSRALLVDLADKLDSNSKADLDRIRAASQRMGQLIDDMLMLSRMSRAELRRAEVDLSSLAATTATEIQHDAPGRVASFQIEPGLTANADKNLTQIVLQNLFENAWKFTSRQAETRIEFGQIANGSDPTFFVRDNGVGFDPEFKHKLFKSFQRLHTAEEFPGTGIGLAIVQRIVDRHGGKVWAEGTLNRGATFFFTLPK